MEKISSRRRAGGVVVAGLAAVSLTGCGPNYSGYGNSFVVRGVVTDPGQQSLKANIYEVKKEEGDARGWFDDEANHQIHDNCTCADGGWIVDNKTVGRAVDLNGNEVPPFQVPIGACVEFTGKIRDDKQGKNNYERPVYDLAREIPCPPDPIQQ